MRNSLPSYAWRFLMVLSGVASICIPYLELDESWLEWRLHTVTTPVFFYCHCGFISGEKLDILLFCTKNHRLTNWSA